jgi:hypothetical protein
MKNKQQGAALVIVLALLAGSLMIGISGMNSALIDERLAGNYRAAAMAQMVAETGAVERRKKISDHSMVDTCSDLKSAVKGENNSLLNRFEVKVLENKGSYAVVYYYGECEHNSKASEIVVGQVKREVNDPVNEFLSVYYYLVFSQPGSGGSSDTGGGSSANFGGEPVVVGGSGVKVSGGGNVSGNIVTSGDVNISGGASVSDSIRAQGDIDYPNWWDEEKSQGFEESFEFDSVAQDPFDIISIYNNLADKTDELTSPPYEYDDTRVGNYPLVDTTIGAGGLIGYNEQNGSDEVMVSTKEFDVSEIPHLSNIPVIRAQDFTQQNGSLTVIGDSLLIVDGDLKLGYGGDEGLLFEGDNTLTIIVNGDVDLKSSLSMEDVSMENSEGVPRFTIYALGEDVKVSGSSQAMARIYAPFAKAKITGSGGLRGAIWVEELEVTGSGKIIGEGAFDVDSGESGGGEGRSVAWESFIE